MLAVYKKTITFAPQLGFHGRVVRQRSAKPRTAVQICLEPLNVKGMSAPRHPFSYLPHCPYSPSVIIPSAQCTSPLSYKSRTLLQLLQCLDSDCQSLHNCPTSLLFLRFTLRCPCPLFPLPLVMMPLLGGLPTIGGYHKLKYGTLSAIRPTILHAVLKHATGSVCQVDRTFPRDGIEIDAPYFPCC